MRRRFLLGIGLLAFAAAGAGSAIAADIAARPAGPPPAVAPAFISDWSGFYVGINGGGGWAHTDYQAGTVLFDDFFGRTFCPDQGVPPNQSGSGGIFGVQFGHNWQWGPVVGGLEIDFDGSSINSTSNFTEPRTLSPSGGFFSAASVTNQVKVDELASARGRLGYLIFPNWLLYGTAGIGWGHVRQTNEISTNFEPSTLTTLSDTSQFGWVAGAGLEYKLAQNWLLRGEWLHYDFGRQSGADNNAFLQINAFSLTNTSIDSSNSRTTVDTVRAAISFKFP
jgi:outer membrane immunogenic protein